MLKGLQRLLSVYYLCPTLNWDGEGVRIFLVPVGFPRSLLPCQPWVNVGSYMIPYGISKSEANFLLYYRNTNQIPRGKP